MNILVMTQIKPQKRMKKVPYLGVFVDPLWIGR